MRLPQIATHMQWQQEATTDDYGRPDEGHVDVGTVKCWIQPAASGGGVDNLESFDQLDVLVSTFKVFLPADSGVDGRDRLVVDGETYEVVGSPGVHRTRRGKHHAEAMARRIS